MSTVGSLNRRRFVLGAGAAGLCLRSMAGQGASPIHFNVAEFDRARILAAADAALQTKPVTVASLPLPPAAPKGLNPHTYYSEDTEFWPPAQSGTWERRPGYSNPDAFTTHQDALIHLNGRVSALVAAWRMTGAERYAQHALEYLRAWFISPETRMDPNMENAGRIPGAQDASDSAMEQAMPLVEIVRAAAFVCASSTTSDQDKTALRAWCAEFLTWMRDSKKGEVARLAPDRTAICWTTAAAELARFTRNDEALLQCSHQFRDALLRQMDLNGAFPHELRRPRPYAASIFTLDCLSLCCEVLSTPFDRLWDYTLPDGRGMRSAIAFLFPSLEDKGKWPYKSDTQHFSDLPNRQPCLLFAGRAYSRPEYLEVWKRLPSEPTSPELLREFPVREPSLWTVRAPA